MLPRHQVVLQRTAGGNVSAVFMSLAVTEYGVLTWPMHRLGNKSSFSLASVGGSCSWVPFFSIDGVFIVPHAPDSPLHCIAQGDISGARVGIVGNLGKPVPLVEWQSKRGWAGVPEGILSKIARSLNLTLPTPHPERDYEVDLAISLMEQFLPQMTKESAGEYLRARSVAGETESSNADVLEQFTSSEMLEDIAGRSEKKFCSDLAKDAKRSKCRQEDICKKIGVTLENKFRKGQPKKAKVSKEAKAFAKNTTSDPNDSRWRNTIKGDPAFMHQHAPPIGQVCVDDNNGRFLLTYTGFPRKSVSWTQRGCNQATIECLRWWWHFHRLATGQEAPAAMGKLWA